MSTKAIVTSTVGFFIIGLLAWSHGLPLTGWVGMAPFGGAGPAIVTLSTILGVLGVLAYLNNEVVNSVILLSFASLAWSHAGGVTTSEGAYGWNVLLWALLFLGIFCAAKNGCTNRAAFALVLGLALVADAIKHWSGSHVFQLIEGYLDLLAGLLALAKSLRTITSCKDASPAGGPPV